MDDTITSSLLHDGTVLLGAALVFVVLFRKLGLGATLGFLIAGVIVGPAGLGLASGAQSKISIAELGITLLLFVVGLELSPARLWKLRRDIFAIGSLQLAGCGLAIVAVINGATHLSLFAAIAVGLPLALSSTAQVLPMLQSAGRLRTPFGERAFAILLFQDLSIILLITIISAMNRNPANTGMLTGWKLAVMTALAIVALVAAGRFILRPMFRLIGKLGEREMFVFAGLFTVIAVSEIMDILGLSTALGAFVAGVMLADTPYRHEIELDVEPFRSILLGLFFLSVGMMLDFTVITERPFFVALMALALISAKTLVITAIGKLAKMEWRDALSLGLLLSQGGEFAFVLFVQAEKAWLISHDVSSLFGAIVTLSMATTPFLMSATKRFRTAPVTSKSASNNEGYFSEPQSEGASAIIVGYGRFGQTVSQVLLAGGISVTLIDRNIKMIEMAHIFGASVFFGDGKRVDVLRKAGADKAGLLLFCIDGEQISADFLKQVHRAFPDIAVHMRAYDRRTLIRLEGAPASSMTREMQESAIFMARVAMRDLGESAESINRAETIFRRLDDERLSSQIASGRFDAARDHILTKPIPLPSDSG